MTDNGVWPKAQSTTPDLPEIPKQDILPLKKDSHKMAPSPKISDQDSFRDKTITDNLNTVSDNVIKN